MWLKQHPNHLPFAEGPFIPGCIDLMTEYSKTGIFARFYYPTNLEGSITDFSKQWIPWSPDNKYIEGFARVVKIWPIILKIVIWLQSGVKYIPVVYGGTPKTDRRLKCIIMSHGLGATRFLSSAICYDLASRGFFVAILEHRDQTSGYTYYYTNSDAVEKDEKTSVYFKQISFGSSDHYERRNKQVKYRSAECSKLFNILDDLNNGRVVHNVLSPLQKDLQFNVRQLKNSLDMSSVSIMGHSFGGATSLLTLAKDKRFKLGIILDAWMFPIKNEEIIYTEIQQPVVFINTQTFHIVPNINSLERLYTPEEGKNTNETKAVDRKMFTMLHTTHEHQSDTPEIMGFWLNWFMKKLSSYLGTKINNCLIVQFLHKHLGYPEDITPVEEFLLSESHNFTEGLTTPWS